MLNPNRKKQIFKPVFPTDPVGAEFCKWFWTSSRGWHWISSDLPAPREKATWTTEPFPIQPDELWRGHQDYSSLIGVGFKELTRYLALDIDRGSGFHPLNHPEKFKQLLTILQSIGLVGAVVTRSSWSEGLHVYFPFSKRISSFGVACAVKWTFFDNGILLGDGQIEIFPNAKSYGANGNIVNYKCHRLPLQPRSDSFLLDGMLSPYSDEVADLLSEFNAAAAQQDLKLLKPVMDASGERQALCRGFGQRGNRAEKWRSHLENRKNTGWTGFSQTNSLIKDMATYGRVFIGLSGKKLIEHTVQSATSAPGYERFCRHQPEIWRRAEDWCKCVEAYYWPYGSDPSRSGTYAEHFNRDYDNDCPRPENNVVEFARSDKRSTQAQDRIKQAIAYLSAQETLPATATARSHAMIATAKQLTGIGISQTTLHKPKYLSLWHPFHYKPQASSGVIDCPERVSANSAEPEVAQTPAGDRLPETSEPLPIKDCCENYTSCPIYEGLVNACPASAAPQAQADAPVLEQLLGGSRGDATVVENAPTDCKINDCNPDETKVVEISTTFHNVNDDAQPTDAGVSASQSDQPVAPQNLGAALSEPAPQIQEQLGECEGEVAAPKSTASVLSAHNVNSALVEPVAAEVQASSADVQAEVAKASVGESPSALAQEMSPELIRRLINLRLEAGRRGRTAARMQQLVQGRLLSLQERHRLEAIAKMQFLWESDEPILRAEVRAIVAANPGILPELPLEIQQQMRESRGAPKGREQSTAPPPE